jgi:hypothetical protein
VIVLRAIRLLRYRRNLHRGIGAWIMAGHALRYRRKLGVSPLTQLDTY